MAHAIATINGADAMCYLDQSPWHGLGQNLLQQMRAATKDRYVDVALDAAQLRYTVGSMPMYLADGTEIPGHKVSVRFNPDGTVAAMFGPVGDGFHHVQNEEAVSLLRVLAEEFGCVPAAAGALHDGRSCWMLMRLADATITPLPGDDVRGYFLLHWGHDGNMSVLGLFSGIRVVCQNTLTMATSGRKAWIAIKHTASASQRLDEAAGLMRKLMGAMATTGETFAAMAHRNLNKAEVEAYIAAAVPNHDQKAANLSPVIEARRDTIKRLLTLGKGAEMANQLAPAGEVSLWAAYNAVTEYYDHVRPAEAQSEAGRINAQVSAAFGGNADLKGQALGIAQQLLAAGA